MGAEGAKGSRVLCVREPEHYADFQRFESVRRWAEGAGLTVTAVGLEGLAALGEDAWRETALAWAPFKHTDSPAIHMERCQAMRAIPEGVPIVLDMDNPDSLLPAVRKHLAGRPLACRAVRDLPPDPAFSLTVPYCNHPARVEPAPVRDVVMLDVHKWEPLSCQLQTLALLDWFGARHARACEAAEVAVKYFLTSFTPIEPYLEAMEGLRAKRFGLSGPVGALAVRDNLVPPAPTREDFLAVLARTRLFVTIHNNLSDMLLCEALANDIPTLILGASAFDPPARELDAWGLGGEPLARWGRGVIEAQPDLRSPDMGWLAASDTRAGGFEVLSGAFLDTWDRLWRWACRR